MVTILIYGNQKMANMKKYDYRVVQNDGSWRAEIVRRASSKKTVISKSQDGFTSESDAQEWGQKELKLFSQNLNDRNKRRTKERDLWHKDSQG